MLTQAYAAWQAGRDKLLAGIAFGIGVLESLLVVAGIIVGSMA